MVECSKLLLRIMPNSSRELEHCPIRSGKSFRKSLNSTTKSLVKSLYWLTNDDESRATESAVLRNCGVIQANFSISCPWPAKRIRACFLQARIEGRKTVFLQTVSLDISSRACPCNLCCNSISSC